MNLNSCISPPFLKIFIFLQVGTSGDCLQVGTSGDVRPVPIKIIPSQLEHLNEKCLIHSYHDSKCRYENRMQCGNDDNWHLEHDIAFNPKKTSEQKTKQKTFRRVRRSMLPLNKINQGFHLTLFNHSKNNLLANAVAKRLNVLKSLIILHARVSSR